MEDLDTQSPIDTTTATMTTTTTTTPPTITETMVTTTTASTAADDIRLRKPTTTKEIKFFGTSFDMVTEEGERRPATLKEIRFFGTSFDENDKNTNSSTTSLPLKHMNKFARAQSFGGSPKMPKPRKFFSPAPSPASSTTTISNTSITSLEKICENNIVDGIYNYNYNCNKSNEKFDITNENRLRKINCDENTSENLLDSKHGKREKMKIRSSSITIDKWQNFSTSATELISRRGVFSRRHYGSVDQIPQTEIDGLDPNCRRFRLENGESLAEKDEVFGSPSTPILENPEHQTRWYFKYFLGKLHQNYVGIDSDKNPYFLSIVSQESGSKNMPLYRAMLFRKQGAQKLALPYNPNQKLTVKQILSNFTIMDSNKTPKEIYAADIQKDLLLLEEQEGSVNFKFGVVYMKPGQKMDDEMLSNEYGSQDFDEFLSILGENIRIKGWERYRGGLDVKGDMTGKYSVYTLYEGHEIMFHVSTLLPFSRDNRQQVERKRHIGNDIVNIVFIDGKYDECEFIPNNIKSQFTHVFAVVTKNNGTYKLAVYCDDTVPPFGPTLPNPPEFEDPAVFRDFLLVKLINGEKATFQTPTFSRKRERTLEMLIKDLYDEYVHDSKMNMLNRRAFSEVLYDAPRASKLKEDARQVEFVRIGQALKLEAIVRGDAPTSIASAGAVFKRPPWEPQCFYPSFQKTGLIVGDSWGQDTVFLASDEGETFLIKEDQTIQSVFDKTLCVRQLSVVEEHGILLLRGGAATHKEGHRIHVFRLSEFQDDEIDCRSRVDIRDRRIEKTRGCHLYSISKSGEAHLRMAVAVGKKLLLFQWKHTAAWTSWCSKNDNDTVDGFIFLREIHLHDSPSIMTILDGSAHIKSDLNCGILVCVGYRHHFEIVSENSGHCVKLHEADTSKKSQTHLITALDLYDGQDTELLLCYNHTCHFQKLEEDGNSSAEFDFHWNTSPTSIVCAFPYIIAFTSESMEIRLLVNGNLVHTVTMAKLQLISSKRDIYFATTAPEFIPKGVKIKGLDADDHENRARYDKPIIEESKAQNSIIRNRISSDEDDKLTPPNYDNLHVNYIDNNFLKSTTEAPSPIQRARSLQSSKSDIKSKDSIECDEIKRTISKSNSYGETTSSVTSGTADGKTPGNKNYPELSVPPNSPKVNAKNNSPSSPTHKLFHKGQTSQYTKQQIEGDSHPAIYNHSSSSSSTSTSTPSSSTSTTKPIKPLRIYRIPLSNLTGTNVHSHHYHYPNSDKKLTKVKTTKISEDKMDGEIVEETTMSIFDKIQNDIQELSMKDRLEQNARNCDNNNSSPIVSFL